MEIILTHEQADFDALAAMLAVSLLKKEACAVLPNRINRNLRKFINLYGSELPFIELRDLPKEPIQTVTLVDTQSLITLKGIHKNTQIHVIDHHQEKTDFPTKWSKRIEKVGATTTLLVEMLREYDAQLSDIQATLLLLGIYEDTGSLTYASTTVRDAEAVVYLLKKGASLRIAAEYLNPALSTAQRVLADQLMETAKTIPIYGKNILIASADASDMNEEISSVAHKLRDLLDPDALFLMVKTREGVRIIARSTSDEVNVAQILTGFGGGGHERAASALLTEASGNIPRNWLELLDKLQTEIRNNVHPSISVMKIMSKKPQLLSTNTSIDEADRVMQRYGYEGYPVVENDKVVGLLTRRAIDRARSHHLNLKVGSLMESGNYSLQPDQSLSEVRDLMATTGWGQIPVVNPETDAIIGIVTRTDLLKNLYTPDKPRPKTQNYAQLLQQAMTPCRLGLLMKIIDISKQNPQGLYIVGGFVRDLILQRPSQDFDIVVEGDAIKLAHSLAKQMGGRVITHRRFGTAKWQIKDIRAELILRLEEKNASIQELPESLDLISARTEFYDRPTALPVVESSSIKQDLHRRDFTINTLALRLDGSHFGELQDYWGGLADLKKKQIKVLHSLSFVDDPTRLLRAVRFEQRFGFHIETRTLQLMDEARENLKQVSGDRIRHEFDLIFKESDPCRVLERLMKLSLLSAIHPDLGWEEGWAGRLNTVLFEEIPSTWNLISPAENIPVETVIAYLVWFSNLPESSITVIGERLHFSNGLLEALKTIPKLRKLEDRLLEMTTSEYVGALRGVPEFALFALYHLVTKEESRERIKLLVTHWRTVEPFTDGEKLKSLGVPPGPRYSQIIIELKNARLDGKITTEKQEQDYLAKILDAI